MTAIGIGQRQPILQVADAFIVSPDSLPISTNRNEVRTFTVTTKSTHADSVDITLDGDVTAVTVTDQTAGTTSSTATEIAAGDYSAAGTGWTAVADGADVIFTSLDLLPSHTGTYSITNATSADGTFAQTTRGQWNKSAVKVATVYVGVTGDLDLLVGNTRVLYENVPVGHFPVLFSVMYPTTTTATNMVAGSSGG